MDNSVIPIFVVGCAVFAVTIASAFLALIASDHPDEPAKEVHRKALGQASNKAGAM